MQRKNILCIYYLIIDSYPDFICESALSGYQTENGRQTAPGQGLDMAVGTILVKREDKRTFETRMQTGKCHYALTYSSVHE